MRSGDSDACWKMTCSRFAAISVLTAWSGTRMIPQSCKAIWTSTESLLDDGDPFTSTRSGRGELRNGQRFGPENGSARQLWSRRSDGDLGRPNFSKYPGE